MGRWVQIEQNDRVVRAAQTDLVVWIEERFSSGRNNG